MSAEQGEGEAAGMPPKANEPACRERAGSTRPEGDSLLPLRKRVCELQTLFCFKDDVRFLDKGVEGTVPHGRCCEKAARMPP